MPAHGGVVAGVHDPGVVGAPHHAVELVVLEQMVIPAPHDGHVWRVVEQVVRDTVPDAVPGDAHPGLADGIPASETVEVAIVHVQPRGGQSLACASVHRDAAAGEVVQVAADDPALSAVQPDSPVTRVPDYRALDPHPRNVPEAHCRTAGTLEDHAAEGHVRHVFQAKQRGQHGDHDLTAVERGRGPEVEQALLPVQVPLSGLVKLRQQVVGIVVHALPEAEVVPGFRLESDPFLRRINGLQLEALVRPVPEPIPVQHDVLLVQPALRTLALVAKDAVPEPLGPANVLRLVPEHLGNGHETSVGPARKGHGLAVEEQFEPGGGRPPTSSGLHLTQVGHALSSQVRLPDVAPGTLIHTRQHGGVGDRRPAAHHLSPHQPHVAVLRAPIDGATLGRAAVLGRQFESLGTLIDTGLELDHHLPGGQRPVRLAPADLVAGAFQAPERPVRPLRIGRTKGPRPGVIPLGRHIHDPDLGSRRPRRQRDQ